MDFPLTPGTRIEVCDRSGTVIGYFVPAADLNQLVSERDALKRVADAFIPLPPMSDDEIRSLTTGPHPSLDDVLAEIDAKVGHGDN